MESEMSIKTGFMPDATGDWVPFNIDITINCHWLIVGGSGSGKSMLLLYLMNSLLNLPISVYIADFKGSGDFSIINTIYAEMERCIDLVEDFYNKFLEIKQGHTGERIMLIFDEYASFLVYLEGIDKKKATDIKSKIAEILMQGRSLPGGGSAWFWCVCQRADSTYFSHGARDNYMVSIGLGRLSKESKSMLFPGEDFPEDYAPETAKGVILVDGEPLRVFKVPKVNKERLKKLLALKSAERVSGASSAGGADVLT